MAYVKPKKYLGQHFLIDENIAKNIVDSLTGFKNYKNILEIGPGMGILTKYLLEKKEYDTYVIDIDEQSTEYIIKNINIDSKKVFNEDFLKYDLSNIIKENYAVIGNFPYNISSQILFKVLENKDKIPEVVGMFQKEVARRINAPTCNREYGIISVFVQAFYKVEILFNVNQTVFHPKPKVTSSVIRLKRNNVKNLNCDEILFKQVVKTAFNQRRKILKNSLSSFKFPDTLNYFMNKRAEELSVDDFVLITNNIISDSLTNN